uniref:Dynamin N-terminal domain-containing protein n=1 Tax=Dunaliella tertiolecta TaxID=3047 RepID=A0A7S3R370_DUNTE
MKDDPCPRAGRAAGFAGAETYAETYAGIGRILEQVGSLLVDLCGGHSIPELDKSLTGAWSVRNQLVSRHAEESLSCAVLALTKSGKSTLINALVGDELLPMNNVPETARICKVVHSERAHQPFMMEPASSLAQQQAKRQSHSDSGLGVEQAVITCRGGPAIRARLQELNRAMRSHDILSTSPSTSSQQLSPLPSFHDAQEPHAATDRPGLDAAGLEGAVSPNAVEGGGPVTVDRNMLAIHTHIAALRSFAEGGRAEAGRGGGPPVRLHLLDTPGPNEAGEAGLRYQVERLLGTVDAAVYLLDYTKLKTEDEATMFERLKEINPALVRRLSQRLFIAVNKVDASLVSEGQDADATREYVAELVTQQMACEGFQLRPDQVLLLSARNALLSRRVLCDGWPKPGDASAAAAAGGPAAAETRARFAQLAFGRFASPDAISPEAAVAAAHALLEDSGVPELEAQVLAHLYNHSGSVKQLALVDDLGRLLAEVRNMSASCASALSAGAESLEARTRALREELTTTLQAFDGVHTHADAITTGVTSEVRAHLHTLRGRLFSHIISALDTSSPPQTSASSCPSSTTSPIGSKGASSWQRVRERFLSIFTSPRMHPVPGSVTTPITQEGGSFCSTKDAMLAAAGAVVARSRSKSELAVLLAALHEDLTHQIHTEVTEFWSVLETVAAARHAELLGVLNKHLQELSAKVEAAVSCSLDVKLAPVKLALAPQNIAQFHCSLEALIAAGVVESRERHIRVGQRQVHERIRRPTGGICRWGHYWEDVPRMRTVVEAYTTSVYELAPAEITKLFITMVRQDCQGSGRTQLQCWLAKHVPIGSLSFTCSYSQSKSKRCKMGFSVNLNELCRACLHHPICMLLLCNFLLIRHPLWNSHATSEGKGTCSSQLETTADEPFACPVPTPSLCLSPLSRFLRWTLRFQRRSRS